MDFMVIACVKKAIEANDYGYVSSSFISRLHRLLYL